MKNSTICFRLDALRETPLNVNAICAVEDSSGCLWLFLHDKMNSEKIYSRKVVLTKSKPNLGLSIIRNMAY